MEFTLKKVDFKTDEVIEETKINLDVTQEELDAYANLFCKCDYLREHPNEKANYVENHNGVDHGWICPSCGKFVQIG